MKTENSHSRRPSVYTKSLSIFLSFSLFFTQAFVNASPGAVTPTIESANGRAGLSALTELISIPEELGHIEETWQGTSDKTIFFIQDAHDSFEAQENIAGLIEYFVGNHKVKTVFEEGYEGRLPTDEYFEFIENPKLKKEISDYLLDKLRLNGAEYAHINRAAATKECRESAKNCGGDFELIGIDDTQLHKKNLEAYRQGSQFQKEVAQDLATLQKEIQDLANRYLPAELKEWFKLKRDYDEGKRDLLDYLKRTLLLVECPDTLFKSTYPILAGVLEAENLEDAEAEAFLSTVRSKQIFQEIRLLEKNLEASWLKNDRDLRIFEYTKSFDLISRLNQFEILPEEYSVVTRDLNRLRTEDLVDFIVKHSKRTLVASKEWEKVIENAVGFYDLVRKRDEALEKKLVEHFSVPSGSWLVTEGNPFGMPGENQKQIVDSQSSHQPPVTSNRAVLIFGGFHAAAIKSILRKHQISYQVMSPRMTEESTRHRKYYKQLMAEGHLEDENLDAISQAALHARLFSQVPRSKFEDFLKANLPSNLAEQLPSSVAKSETRMDSASAASAHWFVESVDWGTFPQILKDHGYTLINRFVRGGSSARTFLAKDKHGKKVIIKYADWEGISGNGTPWLIKQAERLNEIHETYPEEARKLYPKVLDFYHDRDQVAFYAMEYSAAAEDITKYFYYAPEVITEEWFTAVDHFVSLMARTHYAHHLEPYEDEYEENVIHRMRYRLDLLARHEGPVYEHLIKKRPFITGSLAYKDSSYFFEELLGARYVAINGRVYPNLGRLLEIIESKKGEIERRLGPTHHSKYAHGDLIMRNVLRLPTGDIRIIDPRAKNIHPSSPSKTSVEFDLAKIAYGMTLEMVRNDEYQLDGSKEGGGFVFHYREPFRAGQARYRAVHDRYYELLAGNEDLKKLLSPQGSDWLGHVRLMEYANYASDAIHRFSQDPTGRHALTYYLQAIEGLYAFLEDYGLLPDNIMAEDPAIPKTQVAEGTDAIVDELAGHFNQAGKTIRVALNGASNAGKTHFARTLSQKLEADGRSTVKVFVKKAGKTEDEGYELDKDQPFLAVDWFLKDRNTRRLLFQYVEEGAIPLSEYHHLARDMGAYETMLHALDEHIKKADGTTFVYHVPNVYNRATGQNDVSIRIEIEPNATVFAEGIDSIASNTQAYFDDAVFVDNKDPESIVQASLGREQTKPAAKRIPPEKIRAQLEVVDIPRMYFLRHFTQDLHGWMIDNTDHNRPILYSHSAQSETRSRRTELSGRKTGTRHSERDGTSLEPKGSRSETRTKKQDPFRPTRAALRPYDEEILGRRWYIVNSQTKRQRNAERARKNGDAYRSLFIGNGSDPYPAFEASQLKAISYALDKKYPRKVRSNSLANLAEDLGVPLTGQGNEVRMKIVPKDVYRRRGSYHTTASELAKKLGLRGSRDSLDHISVIDFFVGPGLLDMVFKGSGIIKDAKNLYRVLIQMVKDGGTIELSDEMISHDSDSGFGLAAFIGGASSITARWSVNEDEPKPASQIFQDLVHQMGYRYRKIAVGKSQNENDPVYLYTILKSKPTQSRSETRITSTVADTFEAIMEWPPDRVFSVPDVVAETGTRRKLVYEHLDRLKGASLIHSAPTPAGKKGKNYTRRDFSNIPDFEDRKPLISFVLRHYTEPHDHEKVNPLVADILETETALPFHLPEDPLDYLAIEKEEYDDIDYPNLLITFLLLHQYFGTSWVKRIAMLSLVTNISENTLNKLTTRLKEVGLANTLKAYKRGGLWFQLKPLTDKQFPQVVEVLRKHGDSRDRRQLKLAVTAILEGRYNADEQAEAKAEHAPTKQVPVPDVPGVKVTLPAFLNAVGAAEEKNYILRGGVRVGQAKASTVREMLQVSKSGLTPIGNKIDLGRFIYGNNAITKTQEALEKGIDQALERLREGKDYREMPIRISDLTDELKMDHGTISKLLKKWPTIDFVARKVITGKTTLAQKEDMTREWLNTIEDIEPSDVNIAFALGREARLWKDIQPAAQKRISEIQTRWRRELPDRRAKQRWRYVQFVVNKALNALKLAEESGHSQRIRVARLHLRTLEPNHPYLKKGTGKDAEDTTQTSTHRDFSAHRDAILLHMMSLGDHFIKAVGSLVRSVELHVELNGPLSLGNSAAHLLETLPAVMRARQILVGRLIGERAEFKSLLERFSAAVHPGLRSETRVGAFDPETAQDNLERIQTQLAQMIDRLQGKQTHREIYMRGKWSQSDRNKMTQAVRTLENAQKIIALINIQTPADIKHFADKAISRINAIHFSSLPKSEREIETLTQQRDFLVELLKLIIPSKDAAHSETRSASSRPANEASADKQGRVDISSIKDLPAVLEDPTFGKIIDGPTMDEHLREDPERAELKRRLLEIEPRNKIRVEDIFSDLTDADQYKTFRPYFLVDPDGIIQGYTIVLVLDNKRLELKRFEIDPAKRGQGRGSFMMQHLLKLGASLRKDEEFVEAFWKADVGSSAPAFYHRFLHDKAQYTVDDFGNFHIDLATLEDFPPERAQLQAEFLKKLKTREKDVDAKLAEWQKRVENGQFVFTVPEGFGGGYADNVLIARNGLWRFKHDVDENYRLAKLPVPTPPQIHVATYRQIALDLKYFGAAIPELGLPRFNFEEVIASIPRSETRLAAGARVWGRGSSFQSKDRSGFFEGRDAAFVVVQNAKETVKFVAEFLVHAANRVFESRYAHLNFFLTLLQPNGSLINVFDLISNNRQAFTEYTELAPQVFENNRLPPAFRVFRSFFRNSRHIIFSPYPFLVGVKTLPKIREAVKRYFINIIIFMTIKHTVAASIHEHQRLAASAESELGLQSQLKSQVPMPNARKAIHASRSTIRDTRIGPRSETRIETPAWLAEVYQEAGVPEGYPLDVFDEDLGNYVRTPDYLFERTSEALQIPSDQPVTLLVLGSGDLSFEIQLAKRFPNLTIIGIESRLSLHSRAEELIQAAVTLGHIKPDQVIPKQGDFNDHEEFAADFERANRVYYYEHGTNDVHAMIETLGQYLIQPDVRIVTSDEIAGVMSTGPGDMRGLLNHGFQGERIDVHLRAWWRNPEAAPTWRHLLRIENVEIPDWPGAPNGIVAYLFNEYIRDFFSTEKSLEALASAMNLDTSRWQLSLRVADLPEHGDHRSTLKLEVTAENAKEKKSKVFALKISTPYHPSPALEIPLYDHEPGAEKSVTEKFEETPIFGQLFSRIYYYQAFRDETPAMKRAIRLRFGSEGPERGTFYFQLDEWVEGEPLTALLDRVRTSEMAPDKIEAAMRYLATQTLGAAMEGWENLRNRPYNLTVMETGLLYNLDPHRIRVRPYDDNSSLENQVAFFRPVFTDAHGGRAKGNEWALLTAIDRFLSVFESKYNITFTTGEVAELIANHFGYFDSHEFLFELEFKQNDAPQSFRSSAMGEDSSQFLTAFREYYPSILRKRNANSETRKLIIDEKAFAELIRQYAELDKSIGSSFPEMKSYIPGFGEYGPSSTTKAKNILFSIRDLLDEAEETQPPYRLLDFGGGIGFMAYLLAYIHPGTQVVSVEINPFLAAVTQTIRNGVHEGTSNELVEAYFRIPNFPNFRIRKSRERVLRYVENNIIPEIEGVRTALTRMGILESVQPIEGDGFQVEEARFSHFDAIYLNFPYRTSQFTEGSRFRDNFLGKLDGELPPGKFLLLALHEGLVYFDFQQHIGQSVLKYKRKEHSPLHRDAFSAYQKSRSETRSAGSRQGRLDAGSPASNPSAGKRIWGLGSGESSATSHQSLDTLSNTLSADRPTLSAKSRSETRALSDQEVALWNLRNFPFKGPAKIQEELLPSANRAISLLYPSETDHIPNHLRTTAVNTLASFHMPSLIQRARFWHPDHTDAEALVRYASELETNERFRRAEYDHYPRDSHFYKKSARGTHTIGLEETPGETREAFRLELVRIVEEKIAKGDLTLLIYFVGPADGKEILSAAGLLYEILATHPQAPIQKWKSIRLIDLDLGLNSLMTAMNASYDLKSSHSPKRVEALLRSTGAFTFSKKMAALREDLRNWISYYRFNFQDSASIHFLAKLLGQGDMLVSRGNVRWNTRSSPFKKERFGGKLTDRDIKIFGDLTHLVLPGGSIIIEETQALDDGTLRELTQQLRELASLIVLDEETRKTEALVSNIKALSMVFDPEEFGIRNVQGIDPANGIYRKTHDLTATPPESAKSETRIPILEATDEDVRDADRATVQRWLLEIISHLKESGENVIADPEMYFKAVFLNNRVRSLHPAIRGVGKSPKDYKNAKKFIRRFLEKYRPSDSSESARSETRESLASSVERIADSEESIPKLSRDISNGEGQTSGDQPTLASRLDRRTFIEGMEILTASLTMVISLLSSLTSPFKVVTSLFKPLIPSDITEISLRKDSMSTPTSWWVNEFLSLLFDFAIAFSFGGMNLAKKWDEVNINYHKLLYAFNATPLPAQSETRVAADQRQETEDRRQNPVKSLKSQVSSLPSDSSRSETRVTEHIAHSVEGAPELSRNISNAKVQASGDQPTLASRRVMRGIVNRITSLIETTSVSTRASLSSMLSTLVERVSTFSAIIWTSFRNPSTKVPTSDDEKLLLSRVIRGTLDQFQSFVNIILNQLLLLFYSMSAETPLGYMTRLSSAGSLAKSPSPYRSETRVTERIAESVKRGAQISRAETRTQAVRQTIQILRRHSTRLNQVIGQSIAALPAGTGQAQGIAEKVSEELKSLFIEISQVGKGVPEFGELGRQIDAGKFSEKVALDSLFQPFYESGYALFFTPIAMMVEGRLIADLPLLAVYKIEEVEAYSVEQYGKQVHARVANIGAPLVKHYMMAKHGQPVLTAGASLNFKVDGQPVVLLDPKGVKWQLRNWGDHRFYMRHHGQLPERLQTGNPVVDDAIFALFVRQWIELPATLDEFVEQNYPAEKLRTIRHEIGHLDDHELLDERFAYLAELVDTNMPWLRLALVLLNRYAGQSSDVTVHLHDQGAIHFIDEFLPGIFQRHEAGSFGHPISAEMHEIAADISRGYTNAFFQAIPFIPLNVLRLEAQQEIDRLRLPAKSETRISLSQSADSESDGQARARPDYIRELQEDITMAIQILRHEGPLDIEGHIDWDIGYPMRSVATETTDEKLKALFSGYYPEQIRLMHEYRELAAFTKRDNVPFPDAELFEKLLDIEKRYEKWLRRTDAFLHRTSANIEKYLQQSDQIRFWAKYYDDAALDSQMMGNLYQRSILSAAKLIERDLLYLRALHSFLSDRRNRRLSRIDAWRHLSNFLFQTKGLTGDSEFYLPIEAPQVPIPDIGVDKDLFSLTLERLVSNAFIATQRSGFWKKEDAIKKIRIQVAPTADLNSTQITISNPSKISADQLRRKLRLDRDRVHPSHGIGLPFSVRAVEKMGGDIDVIEWDEGEEHRVGIVITFPGMGVKTEEPESQDGNYEEPDPTVKSTRRDLEQLQDSPSQPMPVIPNPADSDLSPAPFAAPGGIAQSEARVDKGKSEEWRVTAGNPFGMESTSGLQSQVSGLKSESKTSLPNAQKTIHDSRYTTHDTRAGSRSETRALEPSPEQVVQRMEGLIEELGGGPEKDDALRFVALFKESGQIHSDLPDPRRPEFITLAVGTDRQGNQIAHVWSDSLFHYPDAILRSVLVHEGRHILNKHLALASLAGTDRVFAKMNEAMPAMRRGREEFLRQDDTILQAMLFELIPNLENETQSYLIGDEIFHQEIADIDAWEQSLPVPARPDAVVAKRTRDIQSIIQHFRSRRNKAGVLDEDQVRLWILHDLIRQQNADPTKHPVLVHFLMIVNLKTNGLVAFDQTQPKTQPFVVTDYIGLMKWLEEQSNRLHVADWLQQFNSRSETRLFEREAGRVKREAIKSKAPISKAQKTKDASLFTNHEPRATLPASFNRPYRAQRYFAEKMGPRMVYIAYEDLMNRFWDEDKNNFTKQGLENLDFGFRHPEKVRFVIYDADITDERLAPFRELRARHHNVWITKVGAEQAYQNTQRDFVKDFDDHQSIHLSKGASDRKEAFGEASRDNIHFFRYEEEDHENGLLAAALLWVDYLENGKWLAGIEKDAEGFLTLAGEYLRQIVQTYEANLIIRLAA